MSAAAPLRGHRSWFAYISAALGSAILALRAWEFAEFEKLRRTRKS